MVKKIIPFVDVVKRKCEKVKIDNKCFIAAYKNLLETVFVEKSTNFQVADIYDSNVTFQ